MPLFVCELVFTLHILVKNLFWRVTLEKWAASQDDVEDHSYTKHVRLTVVALLSQKLWSHIAGRSTAQIELLGGVFDHGGEAKISDLKIPVVFF